MEKADQMSGKEPLICFKIQTKNEKNFAKCSKNDMIKEIRQQEE